MSRFPFYVLIFLLLSVGLTSCQDKTFSTSDFQVMSNFELQGDSLVLEMDLQKGPYEGITLPSPNGMDRDSVFEFKFTLTNESNIEQSFAYKIYYQNESYKHSEWTATNQYNIKSADNFYGSWIGDSLIGFKTTPPLAPSDSMVIKDYFTISGNPLNLTRYFGENPIDKVIKPEDVQILAELIKQDENWFASIKEKASENNRSIDSQLIKDATWQLQNEVKNSELHNQRWQNNPRVGKYEFMLVIGQKEDIDQLPNYVLDMQSTADEFGVRMNPFYFFSKGITDDLSDKISILHAAEKLKTFAVLRPNAGLYYDPVEFVDPTIPENGKGASDRETFRTAHFMQFLNTEYRDSSLHNINMAADVGGVDYSKEDFHSQQKNSPRNIPSYVERPKQPVKNAFYDRENNRLMVSNPGNTEAPFRKENAGVEGRFGFTYGKFRARIKFPETLSKQGVWNGITCAYWLKFQFGKDWNLRDECSNEGYIKSGSNKDDVVRAPRTSYSEIDIEIVKAARTWPLTSYAQPDTVTQHDASLDNNLLVTCTNWDMACPEPSQFGVGVQKFESPVGTFTTHRWDDWYKALTLKTEKPHSETVGEVYEYEIDWQPTKIIWRIGEDAHNMDIVGYMDSTITKIPNNQMTPVMSQEFHYGHWWPTTPYPQGDIPYPSSPIEGALYQIIIE